MLNKLYIHYLYSSCVALFYRKRLPQQNGDRRIGERETSMHLIVCGSEVGTVGAQDYNEIYAYGILAMMA